MKFTKKIAFASASLALTLATPAALLTQNAAFAKTTTVKQATKIKVTKKTTPFYHKDGSKFTKKKPYVYGDWKSTVAYKNTSYNVVKTVTIKGAKYYYIGNDAYLKASAVKVTATKAVKSSSSSKKASTTSKKTSSSSSKTSSKKSSSTSSSSSSKKTSSKKTVTQIQVTKKTTPFYHKDGSKFTKKSPYVYQGWKSTVAYKGTKYKVSKTITIKNKKYYYVGNSAYLKASAVKVIASK
jgi:hypothetical protein